MMVLRASRFAPGGRSYGSNEATQKPCYYHLSQLRSWVGPLRTPACQCLPSEQRKLQEGDRFWWEEGRLTLWSQSDKGGSPPFSLQKVTWVDRMMGIFSRTAASLLPFPSRVNQATCRTDTGMEV